jgi:hypothetical protein
MGFMPLWSLFSIHTRLIFTDVVLLARFYPFSGMEEDLGRNDRTEFRVEFRLWNSISLPNTSHDVFFPSDGWSGLVFVMIGDRFVNRFVNRFWSILVIWCNSRQYLRLCTRTFSSLHLCYILLRVREE